MDVRVAEQEAGLTRGTGLATTLERLVERDRFVKHFGNTARILGWTAGKSVQLTGVDAAGCDFVVSNGDYASDNMSMVLFGLRPSLSMANRKILGLGIRYKSDFNTGPDLRSPGTIPHLAESPVHTSILWSTVPVAGWITPHAEDGGLTRFFIPQSMSMGEANGEYRYAGPEVTDPDAERVRNYYRTVSPRGYLGPDFGDPTVKGTAVAANHTLHVTDWGVSVESLTPEVAQTEMLAAYNGKAKRSSEEVYLYRHEGWRLRVPVQLARANTYQWLDEMGNLIDEAEFQGHVLFDDTLDLPHSCSDVDGFTELLRTLVVKLPDAMTEQTSDPLSGGRA
jgi:hypothetical protein